MKKLIITAYEKPDEKTVIASYHVMINPASLSVSKSIQRDKKKKRLGKVSIPGFTSFNPEELSFELIFDGTGVIDKYKEGHVQDEIKKLEKLIYTYQKESHQSNFLQIKWGDFWFKGYLTSLQINYTLFDSNGKALRAKLNLSFIGYLPPEKFEANPGSASPDLTHIRFATQSDTLANYCDNIYGDPKYLIQSAKFNGLINFRKLKSGKRLEFPPLINVDYV